MRAKIALLVMALLTMTGLAYASHTPAKGFTCPITGEKLPCPNCCPLNK